MASVRDRGQLLLAAGLAVAVALVVVALVLNSAIYTENLTTRDSDVDANGGVELTRDVRTDGGNILYTVNRESLFGYTLLSTRYELAFDDWATVQRRIGARNGRSVEIDVSGPREFGTRIRDDGSGDPEFVPATSGYDALSTASGYTDEWAVVQDAKIRDFEMTVTNTGGLPSGSATAPLTAFTGAFFIEIRDSSGPEQWQIVPYEDPSGNLGIYVWEANAGTLVGTCTPGVTGGIDIDITGGTVEGVPCSALSFVDTLDSTQDIYFNQGDEGEGEYELVADRLMERAGSATGYPFESTVDVTNYGRHCDGPTYEEMTSGEPYAVPALYDVDAPVTYRTDRVTFENDVRIAPGEPGDRARHPRVIRFDVEDNSGGTDAEFNVDWAVENPDGSAPSVTVRLFDASGTLQDDRTTPGVLTDTGGAGSDYTVEITVDDGTNTRVVTESHVSDGDSNGDGTCPE